MKTGVGDIIFESVNALATAGIITGVFYVLGLEYSTDSFLAISAVVFIGGMVNDIR